MASFALWSNFYYGCVALGALLNLAYVATAVSLLGLVVTEALSKPSQPVAGLV